MSAAEGRIESAKSENTAAGETVEIRVRLFGQAREAAGLGERTLRVPRRASVEQAARLLGAEHPGLAPHLERSSYAVNESYARRDERLEEGDELAVIPPIGGG